MTAATEARDEALARVSAAADPAWVNKATNAVRAVALTEDFFTTDQVWEILEIIGRGTATVREPRALGPVMKTAVREGYAIPTLDFMPSKRPECHARPVRVYLSGQRLGMAAR